MNEEPVIAVGLVQEAESISFRLEGDFKDASKKLLPEGEYRVERRDRIIHCRGPVELQSEEIVLTPQDSDKDRFSVEATIGASFHWEQKEKQTFCGNLKLIPVGSGGFAVINEVGLETYITSVTCSEMNASSPPGLIKAHSVISRSWVLAQRSPVRSRQIRRERKGERLRWYDREAHSAFDVCADDHCQRYHGVERIRSAAPYKAVGETRGRVLTFEGSVCDARYSKCCGGVTEDFRAAWADTAVPYLVPLLDGPDESLPLRPLTDEGNFRDFLDSPPDVYCNCSDETLLSTILPLHDHKTRDFFRWTIRLGADEASDLVKENLQSDLGHLVALEPIERGLSGRLTRLRLVGDKESLVIGKELEIRRVLSTSHLYSSAFAIDRDGDGFLLRGAGWGHGVGLCQIGAAVMASNGIGYEEILQHYYPGAGIDRLYR